ncbi:DnaJ domain-containing protein [bacterium]|nr:DnaJ domain-containing protein [bacterium]
MEQKNYYQILGVSENASADDIKKAYRKLAKENHPDTHPGDEGAEARFKEIGEAYDVLKDPAKRKKYDELRRYSMGGGQGSMSYEDFMSRFGGQRSGTNEEFTWGFGGGSLDDIFSSLFGGGARSSRRTRRNPGGFHFDFSGGGRPGTRSGATHGAPHGTPHGAQPREPQATSDPFFKRKGNDAYVDIPVNLAQAMLGSTIRVRTPQGKKVNVKIPAGGPPESVLRLRGMGYAASGTTGDLYIRSHLSLPSSLSDAQREEAAEMFRRWGMKF